MTSDGPVRLGEILKAIRICAPGARVVLETHHYFERLLGFALPASS